MSKGIDLTNSLLSVVLLEDISLSLITNDCLLCSNGFVTEPSVLDRYRHLFFSDRSHLLLLRTSTSTEFKDLIKPIYLLFYLQILYCANVCQVLS